MMRTTSTLVKSLAVCSALLPFCTSGLAQQAASIVYDNSTTDLNQTYGPNGVEFGDEITLAGTDRTVIDFKFEYFLSSNASGNETLQLRFYANDGPTINRTLPDGTTMQSKAPGTLLYTSPVLSLQTGFQTAEASGFSVNVPDDFTYSVTFNGIDSGEVSGLRIYNPPTVGSSFGDFWQKNNGSWNTYIFPDASVPANFAARVTAVPEPTTIAYALLAGVSFLGYRGLRRRA